MSKSKIEALVDALTVEEQVSLLAGKDFWTTVPIERLGIPSIKVSDGPNGARGGGAFVGGVSAAAFPVGIALAATWNLDLVGEIGAALADEARSKGARVLLAPTVNIHRSTLNGRNFECYSEDPFLTSEIAVAYIEGLQARGVAATVKHFIGNESEYQRDTISSDIDERPLREIYMPPFEAAVKRANTWAVMTSYNRLNGTYVSERADIVNDVLKREWGFDGLVMSDWSGTKSTVEAMNGGLDLEMPGPARYRGEKLIEAYRDGKVSAHALREASLRLLRLIDRAALSLTRSSRRSAQTIVRKSARSFAAPVRTGLYCSRTMASCRSIRKPDRRSQLSALTPRPPRLWEEAARKSIRTIA